MLESVSDLDFSSKLNFHVWDSTTNAIKCNPWFLYFKTFIGCLLVYYLLGAELRTWMENTQSYITLKFQKQLFNCFVFLNFPEFL